jgi:hypothetical protein
MLKITSISHVAKSIPTEVIGLVLTDILQRWITFTEVMTNGARLS